MVDFNNVVCVIPARAGSKGVPDKNFREFANGKSLVEFAIEFCKDLNVGRIVVTTDKKNFNICDVNSNVEIHDRSMQAASDGATDFDVLTNLIDDEVLGSNDLVIWIRPTSPMRDKDELREALGKFQKGSFASLRSVKLAQTHPFWMKKIINDQLQPFSSEGNDTSHPQRQMLEDVYELSSEFDFVRCDEALKAGCFIPPPTLGFKTTRYRKMDIDTVQDFDLASNAFVVGAKL